MKERFSKEEWRELLATPFQSFLMVADADGVIDEKELTEFSNIVEGGSRLADPLHRALLVDLNNVDGSEDFANRALTNLPQVKAILKSKLSDDERLHFIQSLFYAGIRVAQASSGGFLGLGDKICVKEKEALAIFVAAYGYTLDDMILDN
jgi:hypothetical protein